MPLPAPADPALGIVAPSRRPSKRGDAATNAAIVRAVLSGEAGPQRDVVLLNAGAAMFVAGHADTVKAGISKTSAAIDSGAAMDVLKRLVAVSKNGASA